MSQFVLRSIFKSLRIGSENNINSISCNIVGVYSGTVDCHMQLASIAERSYTSALQTTCIIKMAVSDVFNVYMQCLKNDLFFVLFTNDTAVTGTHCTIVSCFCVLCK